MEEKISKEKVNRKITNREELAETQIWLTEYNAIRDEIIFRMRTADYFTVVNLGVIGTIIGLTLTITIDILLVIPWISCLLGIMYFNQLRHVQILGLYIRQVITTNLSTKYHNDYLLGWDKFHSSMKSEWSIIPMLGRLPALVFIVPSFLALIVTFYSTIIVNDMWWIKFMWAIELLLCLLLLFVWYKEEKYRNIGKESKQKNV